MSVTTFLAINSQAANVLVVLSDSDHLDLRDGKTYPTGVYLNELMQPVKLLIDAGHIVTFATPKGRIPSVDQNSVDPMFFGGDANAMGEYQSLLEKLAVTAKKGSPVISLRRVAEIGYGHFDALYVPGGHAPMEDLLDSPEMGAVLIAFHQAGKTTALDCHGPIALLSTLPNASSFKRQMQIGLSGEAPQDWIYAGYRMTVFSDEEEVQSKGYLQGGAMKFYPHAALERAGGRLSQGSTPWLSYVVSDRELITGQNPGSALDVGKALLARLPR